MREIPKDKRPPIIQEKPKVEKPFVPKELVNLVELNKDIVEALKDLSKALTKSKPKKSYDSTVVRGSDGKVTNIQTREV